MPVPWYNRQALTDKQYDVFRRILRQGYTHVLPKYGGKVFDYAERGLKRAFPVKVPVSQAPTLVSHKPTYRGGSRLSGMRIKRRRSSSGTIGGGAPLRKRARTARTHRVQKYSKFNRGLPRMIARYQDLKYGPKVYGVRYLRRHGVMIEEDNAQTISGNRTIYFGHYTHPHKAVINCMFYSLAKYIGGRCAGETPSTIESAIGQEGAGVVGDFVVEYVWREYDESETTARNRFTVTGGTTYKGFGNQLRDEWFTIVGDTANTQNRKLENIVVRPVDKDTAGGSTTYTLMKPLHMNASDIKITVYGSSDMKFQNVTLSDAAGSTDKHDIKANPLEGRCYEGKGSYFRFKHNNPGWASQSDANLFVDSANGFGSMLSTDPSATYVDRMIEHPPTHKMWFGLSSNRYVRMQPGTLSKSKIARQHTLGIRRWLDIFSRSFAGANLGSSSSISQPTSIGASRWYGVDKMIHDGADANTIVDVEYHVLVGCVVHHKKKAQITAVYPDVESS